VADDSVSVVLHTDSRCRKFVISLALSGIIDRYTRIFPATKRVRKLRLRSLAAYKQLYESSERRSIQNLPFILVETH